MQGKGRKEKTETVPTVFKSQEMVKETISWLISCCKSNTESSSPQNGEPQRKKQHEFIGQGMITREMSHGITSAAAG